MKRRKHKRAFLKILNAVRKARIVFRPKAIVLMLTLMISLVQKANSQDNRKYTIPHIQQLHRLTEERKDLVRAAGLNLNDDSTKTISSQARYLGTYIYGAFDDLLYVVEDSVAAAIARGDKKRVDEILDEQEAIIRAVHAEEEESEAEKQAKKFRKHVKDYMDYEDVVNRQLRTIESELAGRRITNAIGYTETLIQTVDGYYDHNEFGNVMKAYVYQKILLPIASKALEEADQINTEVRLERNPQKRYELIREALQRFSEIADLLHLLNQSKTYQHEATKQDFHQLREEIEEVFDKLLNQAIVFSRAMAGTNHIGVEHLRTIYAEILDIKLAASERIQTIIDGLSHEYKAISLNEVMNVIEAEDFETAYERIKNKYLLITWQEDYAEDKDNPDDPNNRKRQEQAIDMYLLSKIVKHAQELLINKRYSDAKKFVAGWVKKFSQDGNVLAADKLYGSIWTYSQENMAHWLTPGPEMDANTNFREQLRLASLKFLPRSE